MESKTPSELFPKQTSRKQAKRYRKNKINLSPEALEVLTEMRAAMNGWADDLPFWMDPPISYSVTIEFLVWWFKTSRDANEPQPPMITKFRPLTTRGRKGYSPYLDHLRDSKVPTSD